jgi:hypothetical protein
VRGRSEVRGIVYLLHDSDSREYPIIDGRVIRHRPENLEFALLPVKTEEWQEPAHEKADGADRIGAKQRSNVFAIATSFAELYDQDDALPLARKLRQSPNFRPSPQRLT